MKITIFSFPTINKIVCEMSSQKSTVISIIQVETIVVFKKTNSLQTLILSEKAFGCVLLCMC